MDAVSLTKKLVEFNTINPPGNEAPMADFVGNLLSANGFTVHYPGFGENRKHLVAEKGVPDSGRPLVLSGHFDVVPLGAREWSTDPFVCRVEGDKLYGRGSSDMKSGLAAIICAAIDVPAGNMPEGGIRLILTAGEELGCEGARELVKTYTGLGNASAVIIGEPTANLPGIGHKGAIFLTAVSTGKTVHSSMPELGINAVYKAARAILKTEGFRFNARKDNLLGFPTINVGKVAGGLNANSVPDHAEFTIDMRTTAEVDHKEILARLEKELGAEISLLKHVDLPPVSNNEDDPFIQMVYNICESEGVISARSRSLPYLTDGSVLQDHYHNVPTIILGPGQPEQAHQTDEYCLISKIEQAVNIYKKIIINWRN
jgi:succinyl-diaminopimelate desuccinylase